jgi:hypothetical protein
MEVTTRIDKTPVYVVLLYKAEKVIPLKYYKSILDLFDEEGKLDHNLFIKGVVAAFNEK